MNVLTVLSCMISACYAVRSIPVIKEVQQPKVDLTTLYKQALHQIAGKHSEAWMAARGVLP